MKTDKELPRVCHCRICGSRFYSKSEAQRCVREHGKKNKDNVPRFKRLYK